MPAPSQRKLVGYCTRCGGDCFDDGQHNFHKCPPKRAEAQAIVSLKFQLDRLQDVMARRPWASIVRQEDCADLKVAMTEARKALDEAYPGTAIDPPPPVGNIT